MLGICLGGQLLARALGAEVRPAERLEAGWLEIEPTPEAAGDALLAHLRAPVGVYQWHTDVFDLPDGAVRLARSEQSENQAFRYGERAWGLQFHPEVDAPLFAGWMQNYAEAPARVGIDRDELEAAIAAGSPAFTDALFGAFCSVCVRPFPSEAGLAAGVALAPLRARLQAFGRRLSTPKRMESTGRATKSTSTMTRAAMSNPFPD